MGRNITADDKLKAVFGVERVGRFDSKIDGRSRISEEKESGPIAKPKPRRQKPSIAKRPIGAEQASESAVLPKPKKEKKPWHL